MSTLIANLGAAATLLLAATDTRPLEAELGGMVVDAHSEAPVPSPLAVDVHLYTADACVAGTTTDVDGRYLLTAPEGVYWLRIRVGDQEVANEHVSLAPGSWALDLRIPVPIPSPAELPVARVGGAELTTHT